MTSASPKLTDQQDKALNTDSVSIALTAGAGCGKTFVLTQRFLGYLEPNQSSDDDLLSRIVAITFTDRAAREMRDRIREACQSRLENASLEDVEHWLRILRGLDTARISTIHAFCSGLLRSHAIELGIDPRFQVLEPSASNALIRKTVEETLSKLLEENDEDAHEIVLRFEISKTISLVRSLVEQRFQINEENSEKWNDSKTLAQSWEHEYFSKYLPELLGQFFEATSTQSYIQLVNELNPAETKGTTTKKTILEILEYLKSDDVNYESLSDSLTNLHELSKVAPWGPKKNWDSETYEVMGATFKDIRSKIKSVITNTKVESEHFQIAAEWGTRLWRVTQKVSENYKQTKIAQAALDFDDLLLKTRDLLRDHESIRNQAARGIRYLMLDEFQDTDPVQTEIVRYLSGKNLKTGKLFLVGDIKQSIYRFRRADPEIFQALRMEIPPEGRLPLSTNFRSQPPILNFVNALFPAVMGDRYEPLTPFEKEKYSDSPQIEFLFAWDFKNLDAKENANDLREREAAWIAGRINQILTDKTPTIRQKNPETGKTELRCAEAGDIVILFRAMSNVSLYEEELRKLGIDYYLVGGRAFFAQQEIYDVINLCRCLDEPDDEISLLGVLRSPFFGLSDETLFAIHPAGQSLRESLGSEIPKFVAEQQQTQIRFANQVLQELSAIKNRMSVADLLTLALKKTGYDASLLHEFLGSRKLANLRKLITMARQMDQSGLVSLREFVDQIRDSMSEATQEELAATSPETGNTVRLMTIHQSKGLEFPVVFVADMNRQQIERQSSATLHTELGPIVPIPTVVGPTEHPDASPDNPVAKMSKYYNSLAEEEERYRLLYVALTRAKDRLILSAGLDAKSKLNNPWMTLLANHFNLETGLPALDPLLGQARLSHMSVEEIPEIQVHLDKPVADEKIDKETTKKHSLQEQREMLFEAEATEFGPLSKPIPVDNTHRQQFSVTELEQADQRLNLSNPTSPENSSLEPTSNAQDLGTLVHAVLEHIDFTNSDDFLGRLNSLAQSLNVAHDATLMEAAEKRVLSILEHPISNQLAQAKQLNREIEFLLSWPTETDISSSATIIGEIDCLYQNENNKWILLDYKTGRIAPTVEAAMDHYGIQLALYAFAFKQYYGKTPDEIQLVLIRETIESISIPWTEEIRKEFRGRVTKAILAIRNK